MLLTINNLVVSFETERGELTAVKGVSLSLARGETLALVGESGCGKTVLCKSMLNLLCERGSIREGRILLEGKDLLSCGRTKPQTCRNGDIAMIFQDPMTSLDPTMPVGKQIAEIIKGPEAKSRAVELLRQVEIDNPEERYYQMPHHFSGGMRQRIAIAIALAGKPKLLLADEPTTALDQKTQGQILALLKKIDVATIFITHDLSLAEDFADRAAIMKDGRIVEAGSVKQIFQSPEHPYTKKLLGYLDYGKGRGHNHKKADAPAGSPLIRVENLKKHFPLGKKRVVKALDGFSMELYKGEILGIAGPSGCGKSTLARCLMGICMPTAGTIACFNESRADNWKQMIFQDSASALNPRMTLGRIIGEPLRIAEGRNPSKERIQALMEQAELDPELYSRHPYDVSGGQRQRAAIARAISVDPELIIADEPISSLDVSTQAQIIHLFSRLREERGLTILLIAHDRPMVSHVSDRVIEMG